MSEADAEDGLHGLDAYLDGKNEGTILDLYFEPHALPSKARPDLTPVPPIQFKNASPAKKKSMERRKRGEGGRAVLRAGRRSSHHGIGAYDTVPSHHARGACEVSRFATGNRF